MRRAVFPGLADPSGAGRSAGFRRLPGLAGLAGARRLSGLAAVFAALLLSRCAHVEAPPGGPEDKKAPEIVAVFPAPGSVGVPRELLVKLAFSEYVATPITQAQMSLSPLLPTRLRFKQDGNVITVTSLEKLRENTTYALTVARGLPDLRGNGLKEGFRLVFSTGKRLDAGKVEVRLAAAEAGAGATGGSGGAGGGSSAGFGGTGGAGTSSRMLGLYPLGDSANPGAPDPTRIRPLYALPADSLGIAGADHVRPGVYAVLGFRDLNGNLKPDLPGEEVAFGPPSLSIGPAPSRGNAAEGGPGSAAGQGPDSLIKGVTLALTLSPYDTLPLRLTAATFKAGPEAPRQPVPAAPGRPAFLPAPRLSGILRLAFSREPDPVLALDPSRYRLVRAAARAEAAETLAVAEVWRHPVSGEIELAAPPLLADSLYGIFVTGLTDLRGLALDSARAFASFRPARPAKPVAGPTGSAAPAGPGPDSLARPEVRESPLAGFFLLDEPDRRGLRPLLGEKEAVLRGRLRFFWERGLGHASRRWLEDSLRLVLAAGRDSLNLAFTVEPAGPREGEIRFVTPFEHLGQSLLFLPRSAPRVGAASTPARPSAPARPSTPARPSAPALPPPSVGKVAQPDSALPAPPAPLKSLALASKKTWGGIRFTRSPARKTAPGAFLVLKKPQGGEALRPLSAEASPAWDSLPPGRYGLFLFEDQNRDGRWNAGRHRPWTAQEPFHLLSDSLAVSADSARAPSVSLP